MKMSVYHWWNDADRRKTEVLGEKSCPSAASSTTNLIPAIEPGPPREEAGD
jgi:hypothetical protein